jgi:engulfment/cell motility protein 1
VFAVLREQVTRALQYQMMSFDQFRSKLSHLTFAEITQLWQQERQNRELGELSSPPILELKKKITPEITELIKRQRLNHLIAGMRFTMKLGRRADKFIYCRLSPNHKVLHYGDCDENATPSIDQLPNKLAVVDIKELLMGKDCPHVKDKKTTGAKSGQNPSLAFSIVPSENQSTEPINFVAANEIIFNIWTDAINALLGKRMTSSLMEKDLNTLLSMEIKLRLLDIEGITIPSSPPPIPPEPSNYDFVVKK